VSKSLVVVSRPPTPEKPTVFDFIFWMLVASTEK
jgi:hypothetical protein